MEKPAAQMTHPYTELVLAAPRDLKSGEPFNLPASDPRGTAAVYQALRPAASGELVTGITRGTFAIASASATTFAVGATVHFDHATKLAVAASGGNTFVAGKAALAKTSGQLVVQCELNS